MTTQKRMIAPKTTIWFIPLAGVANPDVAPTVAEINAGTNLSCAILNGYTLNFTSPDTDDSSSLCDAGNVQNQTYDNAELDITFFRDLNLADGASVYNTAFTLLGNGPVEGFWVRRTGKLNTAVAATGDRIDFFGFETDYHKDIDARKTPYEFSVKGIPNGYGDTFVTL